MRLRPYQEQAVESVFNAWTEADSTLLVMPTGTGKTQVFSEIIRRSNPKRAMVLVHRQELAFQAANRLAGLGIECDIEMGEMTAGTHFWDQTPAVISTIQTQCAGNNGDGRMALFKPDEFGVVVIDEAHHATSDTWRRTINHYRKNPSLKVLGVTATPDRADEEALGQVFETVAFDYEILDAINDGWLTPVDQQMIVIEGLDFSAIRTTAGDLNGADLAAVMEAEKPLQGIVSASIESIGDRKAVAFTVTVKQAEMMAEIFNRHKPDMAAHVSGKTPNDERRKLLRDFDTGRLQVLVNVGVLTEGWDSPSCEVIIQARPTKSRCLYAQMVGRAMRPLPGTVDMHDTAEMRKAEIAQSPKPSMLVIDFVGNAGKHKLVTTADILGGKVSDEAIARATEKAKETGAAVRMDKLLEAQQKAIEEARAREAARKAHLVAKARYSVKEVNPFDVFQMVPERARGWDRAKKLSEKQRQFVAKMGIDPNEITFSEATQLIGEQCRRFKENLATFKQIKTLQKFGYHTADLTFDQASILITGLAKNGWRRAYVPQVAQSQS